MDSTGMILLFALIAVVVAGVAIYGYRHAKQRREDLSALARRLGWAFDPWETSSLELHYGLFEIFRRGHSRRAYNTLHGQIEAGGRVYPARMGDFTYKQTSGTGKNRRTTTYHFSYLMVDLPFGLMPNLIIRREGLFDKIAAFFGMPDINFESAEFSRRFHVNSKDRRFAYDLIHPKMMEFLLATTPPTIDIERGRCCLSDGSGCWSVPQFEQRLQWMKDFLTLWPEHLTSHLEATTSRSRYV